MFIGIGVGRSWFNTVPTARAAKLPDAGPPREQLERLSVAAPGMFNRGRQHITDVETGHEYLVAHEVVDTLVKTADSAACWQRDQPRRRLAPARASPVPVRPWWRTRPLCAAPGKSRRAEAYCSLRSGSPRYSSNLSLSLFSILRESSTGFGVGPSATDESALMAAALVVPVRRRAGPSAAASIPARLKSR